MVKERGHSIFVYCSLRPRLFQKSDLRSNGNGNSLTSWV